MTPENHLVAATLGLFKDHARREPGGDEVVRRMVVFRSDDNPWLTVIDAKVRPPDPTPDR